MAHIVEIRPHGRPGDVDLTQSIPWPLMDWKGDLVEKGLVQAGPCFNIKTVVSHNNTRYRNFHYKEKTVRGLSYLYNGNSYTGKTVWSYWKSGKIFAHHTYSIEFFMNVWHFLVNVLSTEHLVASTSANRSDVHWYMAIFSACDIKRVNLGNNECFRDKALRMSRQLFYIL